MVLEQELESPDSGLEIVDVAAWNGAARDGVEPDAFDVGFLAAAAWRYNLSAS